MKIALVLLFSALVLSVSAQKKDKKCIDYSKLRAIEILQVPFNDPTPTITFRAQKSGGEFIVTVNYPDEINKKIPVAEFEPVIAKLKQIYTCQPQSQKEINDGIKGMNVLISSGYNFKVKITSENVNEYIYNNPFEYAKTFPDGYKNITDFLNVFESDLGVKWIK